MDVYNLTWTDRSETEISFVWTTPDLRSPFRNVTYNFTWTPPGGKSYSTSENHTAIEDLTPGRFISTSMMVDSGSEPSPASDSSMINNLTLPKTIIYFKPAEGIVDYYEATLTGGSPNISTKRVSNNTDHVIFKVLYGDRNYTLTLVTHTGNLTNPEQVENPNVSSETSSGFFISWSPPKRANGEITGYMIKAFIGHAYYANITIKCIDDQNEVEVTSPNRIECQDKMNYSISGLISAQNFTVTIAAVNAAGVGKLSTLNASTTGGKNVMDVDNFTWTNRTETNINFIWETPHLREPFTNVTYSFTWSTRDGKSDSTSENHTSVSDLTPGQLYTFTLHINLYDEPNPASKGTTSNKLKPPDITIYFEPAKGIVNYYQATLTGGSENGYTKNVSKDTNNVTFRVLYGDTKYTMTLVTHTSNLTSEPFIEEVKTDVTNKPDNAINNISFEVGSGKDCSKKPTEYCNGPLDTGSQYRNLKETGDDEESEAEDAIDLIRPIKMTNFSSRLQELHRDSNLLFAREYKELQENSPKRSHEISSLEPNRVKNRYVNILAYDHSLVKLLPIDEDDNSDYINANFIPGYNSPREYIATQGPQDSTINDFWRMIWGKNVPIIVMLTGVKEGMKPKCALYWPEDLHVTTQYGDIMITLKDKKTFNTSTLKTFKVCLDEQYIHLSIIMFYIKNEKGTSERTVKHFFMHDWRDYDANLTPTDVVNFICDVRRARPTGDSGPTVVHCRY
ncbi:receptor-type tyrosine-protein phosphatase T-like [Gigantopelta aegis]|uniref:receptor-type tyrosine-protein phosphatase T-like n=1 Tax=Gigantopelta aegis TaxID=1735272 RepID=UPI001B88DA72|nr:receptor-type tyrosine-protein phosphatase T-like [Gigantopelta aegis]